MPCPRLLLLLVFFLFPLSASVAEDKDRLVRTSDPLSTEAQQKTFRLPEGFSMQLFADDAQVGGKPINTAFDSRGRLWVSSTQEYPYAVPKARWSDPQGTRAKDSKDTIRILEDTDGDGRADKSTIFADELNIPTGVLPYGNGCIAFSIPNLWHLQDTDGDGKCDKRTILFGPLGWEKDTHGMVSSLRLGLDGWVYATHGFSNTSHFEVRPENRRRNDETRMTNDEKGKAAEPQVSSFGIRHSDFGNSLDLTSGSVFRFLPDGSRVEPWTTGQVNPFGLCWDSFGNLYSADCHSNPITQLIRGAHYPSFGKPHDGLGFAPVMCTHAHGSTGLCGVVYLDGGVWGPEWDHHMFVGNCVTSRVNHDHITFNGTTPKANEAPDFITCDDPWFRPVDLQLGPDSALYVADFYNSIIGHYEVPLDHPKRDRQRGRIWRVVKEGFTGKLTNGDLGKLDAPALMKELESPNLTRRYQATEQLVTRIGRPALRLSREALTGVSEADDAPLVSGYQRRSVYPVIFGNKAVHALWVASRVGDQAIAYRVGRALISGGPAHKGEPERLCVTAINIIAEKPKFDYGDEITVCDAEFDGRGVFSMRAGGLAIARHAAEIDGVACLLTPYVWDPSPPPGKDNEKPIFETGDASLVHAWKLATRAYLSQPGNFGDLVHIVDDPWYPEIANVAATVPTAEAAEWLLAYMQKHGSNVKQLPSKVTHIARHLPASRDGDLVGLAQQHFGDDLDAQLDLFAAVREGRESQKKSISASEPLATWSADLSKRLLDALKTEPSNPWQPLTPPTDTYPNPWRPTTRKCADGKERTFLDSHVAPGSEKYSATLRSDPFALAPKITFWLAGHRGFPTAEPHEKSYVRLVDHLTGAERARAYPPRNDVATQVTWTFPDANHPKSLVRFELVDGDTATAYAWLAIGGFDPGVAHVPGDAQRRDKRIHMLALLSSGTGSQPVPSEKAPSPSPASAYLTTLPDKSSFTPDTRAALAEFLAANSPDPIAPLFVPLTRDAELAPAIFAILQNSKSPADELANAFRTLPFRSQAKLATSMAGSVDGANSLMKLASPPVLAEPLVSTKLKALKNADIDARLMSLTAALPPQNEALARLITQHIKSFNPAKADAKRGEELFTAVCSICHRIGIRGNLVGPQLDGIGARGVERLLEDILDPNRAVDPAFRLHLVKRKDGSLYAGLLRGEEGDTRIFADAAAQETRIPKSDITSDEESSLSLMPPGMGDVLKEQQLHDLLAYLLARKP